MLSHSPFCHDSCLIPFINILYSFYFTGVSTPVATSSQQEQQQQAYRPAYLDHFEKIDQQNKRNMGGNKGGRDQNMKGEGGPNFPGKFLGPIDFEFVSNIHPS